MSWLSSVQDWFANAAKGDGVIIALVLGAVSAAIGMAVAVNWRPKMFLVMAIVLNLLYWVVGQGFGGIFKGGATDPNAGLLFVLFACAHVRAGALRAAVEEQATEVVKAREVAVPG